MNSRSCLFARRASIFGFSHFRFLNKRDLCDMLPIRSVGVEHLQFLKFLSSHLPSRALGTFFAVSDRFMFYLFD